MPFRLSRILTPLLLVAAHHALAWGPHPEITRAGIDQLKASDPLRTCLGRQVDDLPVYCWMADWRTTFQTQSGRWYYADDYLLFPGFNYHEQHICPQVEKTYAPYFRRALLALRTESPWNAARWTGALLHFVEDTGSPPHAASVLGPIHSKMENWVDAKQIHIPGYQPQLLGATEEAAIAGLEKRMQGLIAFSKGVFNEAEPHVKKDDRTATEPIVLRSALETAKVVADVLHTLGTLAQTSTVTGHSLKGQISGFPAFEKTGPALKLTLAGTDYSTTAENDGRFAWQNLPAGQYTLRLTGLGIAPFTQNITVPSDSDKTLNIQVQPGSWLREAALSGHWLKAASPDGWTARKGAWESEWMPWPSGCRFQLDFTTATPSSDLKVEAVAAASPRYGVPTSIIGHVDAGQPETTLPASEHFKCLRLVIRGTEKPWETITSLRLQIHAPDR